MCLDWFELSVIRQGGLMFPRWFYVVLGCAFMVWGIVFCVLYVGLYFWVVAYGL